MIVATRLAALLQGTVTYEDGCMNVNSDSPDRAHTLVWPLDQYSIEIKSDRVIFEDQTTYGTSGEWIFGSKISISGGEMYGNPSTFEPNFPHQPIPDYCTRKLWVIGDAN